MRISAIKGCVSSDRRVTGISVLLRDTLDQNNTLVLPSVGDATGWCTTFRIRSEEEYIKAIEISYDRSGLTYVAIVSTDEVMVFGEQTRVLNSNKAILNFTEEAQPIGFWGTEDNQLMSLGVLLYKSSCMVDDAELAPIEEEEDSEVE